MPTAQNDFSSDQARSLKAERSDDVRAGGILQPFASQNGVRIATLNRIFVVVLVFMTFSIVGITLIKVGEGRKVVDQWRAIEHQNIARHTVARRLDLAELVTSFQVFLDRPDKASAQAVLSYVDDIETSMEAYTARSKVSTGSRALVSIKRALDNYRQAVTKLPDNKDLRSGGVARNSKIAVDTYDAIIAIKQLKAENDYQRETGFDRMDASVDDLMSALNLVAVLSSIMVAAIGVLIWGSSTRMLIRPLETLRQNMINLAKGDVSVALQSDQMLLDIREMATSVEVFRRNLIDAERMRRVDKTAQRRIKILSQAIDQSPASMVLIDLEKRIQFFNPQFCQDLGYTPEELIGLSFKFVLDPNLADDLGGAIWSTVSEADSWNGEIQTQSKNGEKKWQHTVVSPVRDGDEEISYYLVVMEDISRQKESEAHLINAMETAEMAYRSKTEFLANMTHELRTPLNVIIGFSEIIKGEMLGPIEQPEYVEYSNDILESGKHLLSLIEDILSFSKFEAGKPVLVEGQFDLLPAFLLTRNIAGERARLQNINIRLELPSAPLNIFADERKIRQILLNLISNAVKFSHPGSEVTAGARVGPDGQILMFVEDHGIGLSADNIATALAPFGQVESKLSRTYEGTGLGLPLSRALAEAHGGRLTMDSELGTGTTVIVSLPKERNLQIDHSHISDCA